MFINRLGGWMGLRIICAPGTLNLGRSSQASGFFSRSCHSKWPASEANQTRCSVPHEQIVRGTAQAHWGGGRTRHEGVCGAIEISSLLIRACMREVANCV